VGNGVDLVHLLGSHAGQVAGPFVGAEHDVVGDHVQLLLGLALDVLAVQGAHDAHQGTLVDRVGNHLDGGDQVVEQGGKVAGGAGDVALLLDDELVSVVPVCMARPLGKY
jgi:hypothetical protein